MAAHPLPLAKCFGKALPLAILARLALKPDWR